MYIEIDFNSDEALYMQLRNQIIMGIAMIVIVVNFLVDVIYRIVDPRIGLEDE